MSKVQYAKKLFDDIKDEVDCDSDIIALESLLLILLDNDVQESILNWKYLILKYDINKLMKDIDFLPIIKDYPNALLKKINVDLFFQYMNDFPLEKMQIIYNQIFNIYESDCFIYQSLNYYISKHNYVEEKKFIHAILNQSKNFFIGVFDQTEFIRRIILLHLKHHQINDDYIFELIKCVDNKKDQAVLKTLLIDYINI